MPETLLTVLKFCFLALVYLFLFRVVRLVTLELKAAKIPVAVPEVAAPAATPPPAPARRTRKERAAGSLRIVEPAARAGETYPLTQEVTVGRAPGCSVVLADDTFVSQVHARVYHQGGETYLEDLGSTNGTLLNGERISGSVRIRRGDRMQFGQTVAELTR